MYKKQFALTEQDQKIQFLPEEIFTKFPSEILKELRAINIDKTMDKTKIVEQLVANTPDHLKEKMTTHILQNFRNIDKKEAIKMAVAVLGICYSFFIFSLPLLVHYGGGNSLGGTSQIRNTVDFNLLAQTVEKVSLFKIHSSGMLGAFHTITLSLLTVFGLEMIQEAIQELMWKRLDKPKILELFPEFSSFNKNIFMQQVSLTNRELTDKLLVTLSQKNFLEKKQENYQATTKIADKNLLYQTIFDLGLTLGETDRIVNYLTDISEKNLGIFFKKTVKQKYKARPLSLLTNPLVICSIPESLAKKSTKNDELKIEFLDYLSEGQRELFHKTLIKAKQRNFSIETQIAASIALPFTVSLYNLVSGNYIPCCPIHAKAIEDCLGKPFQNYAGALPGLGESAFLAIMMGYVGEKMEAVASGLARKNLDKALSSSQLSEKYLIKRGNQKLELTTAEINQNDIIVLKKGEQLPVDGIILKPFIASQANLTGESAGIAKIPGETILAGAINLSDTAELKVIHDYHNSAINQKEQQINNALKAQNYTESNVDKFAKYWIPTMGIFSIGYFIYGVLSANMFAIKNALMILVSTTPCALKIAIPSAKTATIAWLAKNNIILRNTDVLSNANKIQTIIFDKTDTITDNNRLEFSNLNYDKNYQLNQLLEILYAAELNAIHPIAEEIRKYILTKSDTINPDTGNIKIKSFTDYGKGIEVKYCDQTGQQHTTVIGSYKLIQEKLGSLPKHLSQNSLIMTIDNQIVLSMDYQEAIRQDAASTIHTLMKMGINVVIASGDTKDRVDKVIQKLNQQLQKLGNYQILSKNVYAEQTPQDKTELVRAFQQENILVSMVGDGNNDSEAIVISDFGISWNAKGLAKNGAHAIVTDGSKLSKIIDILNMSKKYNHNINQNIVLPLLGNVILIASLVSGQTSLLLAKIGGTALRTGDLFISMILHESISIFAGLNAYRLIKGPRSFLKKFFNN